MINGEAFTLSQVQTNKSAVLQNFLHPSKRKKFLELFTQSDNINGYIKSVRESVTSLSNRIDDGIDRAGVRKWTKSRIRQIIEILKYDIDTLN